MRIGLLLSRYLIELSRLKKLGNGSNARIASATTQLVLENLFVFSIKQIVALCELLLFANTHLNLASNRNVLEAWHIIG